MARGRPLVRLDNEGWVELPDPPFIPRQGFIEDGEETNEFAQGKPCHDAHPNFPDDYNPDFPWREI